MNANETGGAQAKRSRGISILLIVQLLIAAATVVVMVVVGQRIKPLIEQRRQLGEEITQLQSQREYLRSTLDSLSIRIDESLKKIEDRKLESAQVALTSAKEEVAQARATVPDTVRIPARIFIHIRGEYQREAAKKIGARLQAAGYLVPGIERLVDKGPEATELRFLRKAEQEEAAKIVGLLNKMGVQVKLADHSANYENAKNVRPGTYELWFAPGEFEQQFKKR